MSDNHEQALELREQVLSAFDYGRILSADPLLGQATVLDPSAMEEVVVYLDRASGLADNGAGPDDDEEDEDDDDDDDDDDDEDEDDEEEDDVPGIDEEEDEDPDEEDEEE